MIRLINIYKNLKTILEDSNKALIDKNLDKVDTLQKISIIIKNLEINRLPYIFKKEEFKISTNDLQTITTIRQSAFSYNSKLIRIDIPSNITTIGKWAFSNCNNLKNIYLYSSTPPVLSSLYDIPIGVNIHVPMGSKEVYESATNWSKYVGYIFDDIIIN